MREVWDEWLAVTRLVRSGAIAFRYEVDRWAALAPEQLDTSEILIGMDDQGRRYRVALQEHLGALRDEHTLGSIVLLHSNGLMERLVRVALQRLDGAGHLRALPRWHSPHTDEGGRAFLSSGGVEAWARDLVQLLGYDWTKVLDGLAGLVEVSIVRNAIAHGSNTVTDSMENRALQAGAALPWLKNDRIVLTLVRVERYRSRLKSFMQSVENGTSALLR
jgi:hypothetical protein